MLATALNLFGFNVLEPPRVVCVIRFRSDISVEFERGQSCSTTDFRRFPAQNEWMRQVAPNTQREQQGRLLRYQTSR